MALRSTQLLTEMSTRNISWGIKTAGAYGWQPYHLYVPTVLKSGILNLLEPLGPVQACNGIVLPFYLSQQRYKKIIRNIQRFLFSRLKWVTFCSSFLKWLTFIKIHRIKRKRAHIF